MFSELFDCLMCALQQIVMVQPLTITADGQLQLQDGQAIDASQIQILSNDQQVFDTSAVHTNTYEPVTFENQTLQQLQYDASTGQLLQVSPSFNSYFGLLRFKNQVLVLSCYACLIYVEGYSFAKR